ncbi:hypothetical protein N9E37_03480 [Luminiphilus sp.]|nr:hypothetical protein [Luminiphilus sp.]
MAIDYTGMFTGERPNPSAGVAGMPRDLLGQTLQGIQQGEQRSRQALGQMMGKDLRSSADQAREQLSQVDINSVNTPEGLLKLAQMKQATGDTGAAMALASQAQTLRNAQAATIQEQKRYTAEQALEERKVAAAELKAAGATKPKVYEPKINIDKDGNITVISTDPATAGTVISRNSTKSEAQQIAEDVVKRQEEENKIRNLVVKRNILSGQADEVRLALKEAEEEASLPLAANLQLQQSSPLYGSLMSGNTYKKLNNAVTSVKSQQALNTIAEMKKQSSTGATGLGATNAMEFIALESAIRALDPLVPSTIEGNLQAIEQNLNNIILINQGKEPKINWDLPVYSHMVYPTSDGGRAYSYDGKTFYKIAESAEQ